MAKAPTSLPPPAWRAWCANSSSLEARPRSFPAAGGAAALRPVLRRERRSQDVHRRGRQAPWLQVNRADETFLEGAARRPGAQADPARRAAPFVGRLPRPVRERDARRERPRLLEGKPPQPEARRREVRRATAD